MVLGYASLTPTYELQIGQLEIMQLQVVSKAWECFKHSNVDFPYHLLARVNDLNGCKATVAFDEKSIKKLSFELLN